MKILLTVTATAVALLVTGCDQVSPIKRAPSTSGLGGAGGGSGSGGTNGGPPTPGAAGLPCDVEAIVVKYCASCHGTSPSNGAPRALATYADLTRKDLITSGITEAQAALQRMQNKSSPMPPLPAAGPTSAELSTFQNWISNSYPAGTCGVASAGGSNAGGSGGGGGNGSGNGGAGGSSSSGTIPATGLPCDVQAVFVNNCASCHGTTPSGGAPRSLITYANLTLSDPANTSMTEAQVALQRMQSSVAPMPPYPSNPLGSSDISVVKNWISSGYPKGTCGSSAGGSSGNGSGGSGGSAGSGSGGSGGDAGVAANGLPCDIQTIVVKNCASCHGTMPAGGAPRSLVTYANLTMSDPANPSMTEAQVALQRMQNTGAPMPPAPAALVSSADITAFQNWINSGYPKGTCGATGGAGGSASGGSGGGGAAGSGGSSGGSDAGVAGGVLPCDVQTLLANRCDSCHGSTPAGGAPRSLVTYSNLTLADPANTSMTEAQVALQRMQNTASPMPPSPASPATSAEVTALQNWINAGYPSGPGCTGDAGTVGPDPLNASPTCTSKVTWNGGEGSSTMDPGQACISCHSRSGEAPKFVIAGTLYPTGHEPNNCYGTSGNTGARVVVTGSNGTSVTLTPNSSGNFYTSTGLAGPYKAKVVDSAGKERVMVSTAPNGDCNSCHTQSGTNSAPGRITLP